MAKQVQVLVICDWCKKRWQEGDEECPEERDWTWNGGDFMVELCAPCRDKVRDFLQPLFDASEQKKRGRGRPPMPASQKRKNQLPRGSFDKYKNEEGKFVCPFRGEDGQLCGRDFDYPQHLGNHHHRRHGNFLD